MDPRRRLHPQVLCDLRQGQQQGGALPPALSPFSPLLGQTPLSWPSMPLSLSTIKPWKCINVLSFSGKGRVRLQHLHGADDDGLSPSCWWGPLFPPTMMLASHKCLGPRAKPSPHWQGSPVLCLFLGLVAPVGITSAEPLAAPSWPIPSLQQATHVHWRDNQKIHPRDAVPQGVVLVMLLATTWVPPHALAPSGSPSCANTLHFKAWQQVACKSQKGSGMTAGSR